MLQALVYLQEKKIVHCDVKPENILQNRNGKNFYLADFGLSNYLANARSGRGTPVYMAPETFERGEIGTTADIWSLGVVLLEVILDLPLCFDIKNNHKQWHRRIMLLAAKCQEDSSFCVC
jgi:serine/threonine protein kinase